MATYDQELLAAAMLLLRRRSGLRGRLPSARIRRSISTTYYALFHFVLGEVGLQVIGTTNDLRPRRRTLSRTISHKAMKVALDKLRGASADASIVDFMRSGAPAGPVPVPRFLRNFALVFSDAQAKREDADYNLNETLSAADARLLAIRARRAIERWRDAKGPGDRDMKHAACVLILLKGQLRAEK